MGWHTALRPVNVLTESTFKIESLSDISNALCVRFRKRVDIRELNYWGLHNPNRASVSPPPIAGPCVATSGHLATPEKCETEHSNAPPPVVGYIGFGDTILKGFSEMSYAAIVRRFSIILKHKKFDCAAHWP